MKKNCYFSFFSRSWFLSDYIMPRSRRVSKTIGEIYSSKVYLHTCRNVNPILIKLLERVSLSLDCWKLSRSLDTWLVWKRVPMLCFPMCNRVRGWEGGGQGSACTFSGRGPSWKEVPVDLTGIHQNWEVGIFLTAYILLVFSFSPLLNSHSALLSSNRCHPCIMEYLDLHPYLLNQASSWDLLPEC